MIILKKYLFRNDDTGESGGGEAVLDRGDDLEPKVVAAAEPEGTDPASKALIADLKLEKAPPADDKGDDKGDEKDDDKDEDDKRKGARIPLDRHEKILAKERAARTELEGKLAEYQRGGQVAAINADITALETSVVKLEKEYATALVDGEIDKATAIMVEIRKAERDMSEAKSDMKIEAAEARATERARYNVTLERIEASYPTLNPDHEDFNAELMGEVAELKSAYESRGRTPTAALQKAVDLLIGAETAKQKDATTVTPRVAEKDVAAERKAAAVTKTVAAVNKTPPSANRVGLDSDKLGGDLSANDVVKMDQDDFAKLSDSALAKMRGDEL